MKSPTEYTITVANKRYVATLGKASSETTQVVCEAANINQEFLNEDIPALLVDLPNLIVDEKNHANAQNKVIRFRVSSEDKILIEKAAVKKGYTSVSSFLRDLSLGRA